MYKKNSLGNLVLLALEKSVDGYMIFENFTYHPLWVERNIKKTALSLTLKRLRERGLIDFIDDNKLAIKLTDKGLEKAIFSKIMLDGSKWDGKWRVVMFDIPEKRRLARDLLRIRLKSWGFSQRQKSVWVSKKDCAKALRDYIKQVGIKDWVIVMESDNID